MRGVSISFALRKSAEFNSLAVHQFKIKWINYPNIVANWIEAVELNKITPSITEEKIIIDKLLDLTSLILKEIESNK